MMTFLFFIIGMSQAEAFGSYLNTASILLESLPGIQLVSVSPEKVVLKGEIERSEDLQLIQEIVRRSPGPINNETQLSEGLKDRLREDILSRLKRPDLSRESFRFHGQDLWVPLGLSSQELEIVRSLYPQIKQKVARSRSNRGRESIFLELAFVEIRKEKLRQLGLRFGSPIAFDTLIHPRNIGSSGPVARLQGFNPIGSFLDAALNQGQARILLKQSLIGVEDQDAVFRVGGEINVRLTSENSSQLGKIGYGMILKFRPIEIRQDQVFIHIDASIKEPIGTGIDSLPAIEVRDLNTSATLQFDQSLALAGFFQDRHARSRESIPGLGEVPVIGRLFASKSFRNQKSEAYIFVTPKRMSSSRGGE